MDSFNERDKRPQPQEESGADGHTGRKFYAAMQSQAFGDAADYLTIMVRRHLSQDPDHDNTLQIFISAHLVSAIDLAGHLEIKQLAPMEDIIRTEIQRFRTEYTQHADKVSLLAHHVMQKISALRGLDEPHATGRMGLVKNYIDKYYGSPDLNVTDLSVKFDLSISHLSRVFKAATGVKISDYIHTVRIQNAKTLLSSTNLSISKIAEQVGFSSSSAFIRAYRAIEGITPGTFRDMVGQMRS